MTTVSRSQQHIEEAYHGMRLDLKRRQLPFHFLLGDITDEKFLATEITGNRNLVCIISTALLLLLPHTLQHSFSTPSAIHASVAQS